MHYFHSTVLQRFMKWLIETTLYKVRSRCVLFNFVSVTYVTDLIRMFCFV